MHKVDFVNVFTLSGQGGNPCPVVADAQGMSAHDMQAIAKHYGHEAGFVFPTENDDVDFAFRFFVPNHEMEMCGHATIGALWVLTQQNRLTESAIRISTRSGPVTGYVGRDEDGAPAIEITQPAGKVVPLTNAQGDAVLHALGVTRDALADLPLHNAVTSRVKTLVPMRDVERLHALVANVPAVESACRLIGSTGLYPYAVADESARVFEARQFPRASGYPEDAATGIAAAALAFGLLRDGLITPDDRTIRVLQGRAMRRLSEIRVRIGFAQGRAVGCLLGGAVSQADAHNHAVAA
ncbi:PhzF family phenazine biosynthesis isomerase [Xanthobacter sp. KR7-225]|uniref:PhzF family phenazine biosynthesis protein n=1 Tax=Xanthobacter sp. KR7-225 TaxID=3156613 RepID=UPI0032B60990